MTPDFFAEITEQLSKRAAQKKKAVEIVDRIANAAPAVSQIKRVNNRGLSYNQRHRGEWFKPEYDFDEIQIAQGRDSLLGRAIQKKVNKLLCAGYEFTGMNPESVAYIQKRFHEMQFATNLPTVVFFAELFNDLFRYNNCMLVKVRNRKASSGKVRTVNGSTLEPVAGYFTLPFETLYFKANKNGTKSRVLQRMPNGEEKEFHPRDLVHFYTNKNPGFAVGTPELWAALDDIALLRAIEENVQELIETNLFPVYHYKVGSDAFPERVGMDGNRETDVVKKHIEYMPAGGIYVSDHRHEISAVGSEGRALRIDFYLSYFKNRVYAAIGASPIDMGEGSTSNRSTASTMSKAMLMDIEAMACIIESFFDFYIINELLLEGGYDPLDERDLVHLKFGVIDKEERRADENHLIQSFHGKVRDIDEVRAAMGEKPWEDSQMEKTYYKMYEEPLALLRGLGPGSAAGEILAGLPGSNVTPEAVAKEAQFAKQMEKVGAGVQGTRPNSSSTGSSRASAARARPSNQHGTRSTTRTNRDTQTIFSPDGKHKFVLPSELDVKLEDLSAWKKIVHDRYSKLEKFGVSFGTVAENLLWRLEAPSNRF